MATIRQRTQKNGELVFDIIVRYIDKGSGERVQRSMSWKPKDEGISNKKAPSHVHVIAEQFEQQVQNSLLGKTQVSNPLNITFREFCQKWLERTKRECSLAYYVKATEQLEYACAYIGGYKMTELNPAIIQSFFDQLDERRKIVTRIKPKSAMRKIVKSYKIPLKMLEEAKISTKILQNAYEGKNVSEKWALKFCEFTGIPFHLLFEKQEIEEPYAWETNVQYKRTVRCVLSLAKKNRLIQDNWASAEYIDYPKKIKVPISVLDDDEATTLYETLMNWNNIKQKAAIAIFLLAGFRRGEVCGLEWKDVDFVNKTITVARSVIFIKGHGLIEKSPKSESSKRKIGIPATLVAILQEYREFWLKMREMCGDYIKESDKLFTTERGDTMNPNNLMHWLDTMLKQAGLEHHSLHSLRHTNITLQLLAGVPLVTVSARAGHSKVSTTSDIYSHVVQSSDRQAAEMLDDLLKSKLKKD